MATFDYEENHRRTCGNYYVTTASLLKSGASAAFVLLNSCDDSSYIVHFGFDVASFDELHREFDKKYPQVVGTGRRRALSSRMVLVLVLMWLHNKMKYGSLGLIFGARLRQQLEEVTGLDWIHCTGYSTTTNLIIAGKLSGRPQLE